MASLRHIHRSATRLSACLASIHGYFADRFPDPADARTAAGAFVASLALLAASGGGLIAVALPDPGTTSRGVASAVGRLVEGRADAQLSFTSRSARTTPTSAPTSRTEAVAGPHDAGPTAAATAPRPPARRGALPVGKGMWLWLPERVEGGDPNAIVARALHVGLTHVYVRTGSSRMGFYAQDFLNRLLPVAHAHGIRVYGWDFPYLHDWQADVARAVAAITYTTPDGHRIDGFSADIETRAEGVAITAGAAAAYGHHLRKAVGPNYPLIATVPRPNPALVTYPFAEVVASFDAIAPMVYWMHRDPGVDVALAIQYLSQFGKPVIPIGQAYDGAPEGGPPGVPSRGAIHRFMGEAERFGANAVSFWSWQHATQEVWDAIRDSTWFRLPAGTPSTLVPAEVREYQALLTSLGFAVAQTGAWDAATTEAVLAFQRAAGLPATGVVDASTRALLLAPFAPPVEPQP